MMTYLRSAFIVALSFATAGIARAQLKGAEACSPAVYNDTKPGEDAGDLARMHPLVARARYASLVENERWVDAMRALRFDAAEAFVNAKVPEPDRNEFFAEVDAVIDALPALPKTGDGARAAYVNATIKADRFEPLPGSSAYTLFTRDHQIPVGDLPRDQARALCWSAMSADLILFRLVKPLEGAAIARLTGFTRSWSNYRTYGYTRQPLELMIWHGSVRDSLPSMTQWIFGHLSAAGELHGWSIDSLKGNNSALIEFGGIRYRNNFTQYFGASGIISVASGRPVGAGGLIHFARGLRGGVVFRREGGKTTNSVLVSTDLYGLLDRSKKSVDDGLAIARGLALLPTPDGK